MLIAPRARGGIRLHNVITYQARSINHSRTRSEQDTAGHYRKSLKNVSQKRRGSDDDHQPANKKAPVNIPGYKYRRHDTLGSSETAERSETPPPYGYEFHNLRNIRFQERLRSWAGTIVVTDSGSVTDEDLLHELPDRKVDFTVTTAVLLFTPELARFHTEEFVKKILTHLCRGYLQRPSIQSLIRVVTGIVDKVPGSSDNSRPRSPASEGMSVILSNSFMDQVLLDADVNSDQPAILRFSSVIDHLKYPSDDQVELMGAHEVHLPMANTLFVNGRHSTLAASFWKRAQEGSLKPLKLVQGFRYLRSFMVNVGVPSGAMFGSIIPLKPLTKPRLIRTAMGNIIREIEIDGKVVPAASELESSVQEFTRSHDKVAIGGKVLVFALVRDAEANSILHIPQPIVTSAKIKAWLDSGARLLRVTGGGGGWGQKKGLLSLEPSTGFGVYDGDHSNATHEDNKNNGDAGADVEDTTQLPVMGKATNLVQPGGIVQFFVCVGELPNPPTANRRQFGAREKVKEYDRHFTHTLVAGMIPQAESTAMDRSTSDGKRIESRAHFIKDTFGAMSEQGLGLVIKEFGEAHPEYITPMRRRPQRMLSSTRFDVPHMRFEYKVRQRREMVAGRPLDVEAVDKLAWTQAQWGSGDGLGRQAGNMVFDAEVPVQDVITELGPQDPKDVSEEDLRTERRDGGRRRMGWTTQDLEDAVK